VNSHTLPGGPEFQDDAVAKVYQDFLNLMLRETSVRTVLTWGITDAHTWLNQSRQPWALRADGARQRPLPFDDEYEPTPAFLAMRGTFDAARNTALPVEVPVSHPVSSDPYAPFSVPGSPAPVPPQPRI
jgi:endo-1,4-beta-xylanase